MSFSSQIKDEIIKIENMPDCCRHAMAYGIMLFGRSFGLKDISIMTDNEKVANKYIELSESVIGVKPSLSVSEAGKHTVSFDTAENREKVLSAFSCTGKEHTLRIDRGNLLNDTVDGEDSVNCCDAAFIRGAFLSCGTASDPNKSYHIEFVVPFKTLSLDLLKILNDYGIKAKHLVRRYVNVIYVKESESVEDLLTIMGAQNSALEIMNIKIYKDLRNRTNRRLNFESANLSRTVCASYEQIHAIENIQNKDAFDSLPEDLKQVALLRADNPDASLREIGEMCTPVMSRSAVNYRIKKLIEISAKLDEPTEV